MERTTVSKATLGRLPEYLKVLKNLPLSQYPYISATTIAKMLNLGEVQVRKDLAAVSGTGKPKIGYITENLISRIEQYLGHNERTPVVLVGTGKLGHALLQYSEFAQFGVEIVAAFDSDESVIDANSSPQILPMSSFERYCQEHNIKIGIITVGRNSAQEVCDEMVNCGIVAIWNFAPCKLNVPSKVIVENENLALSLARLNNLLRK